MDIFWLILGILLLLTGIAGSALPILPGPPLCFVALLIQQLKSEPPFSTRFLVIWGIVTLVVTLLDYLVPMYGTKRFGGSKYGMWGCTLGLLIGLFFSPWGIVAGPFLGAFIGELIARNNSNHALKAAIGSFIGFLLGTLLKLVACFVMAWYFVVSSIQ